MWRPGWRARSAAVCCSTSASRRAPCGGWCSRRSRCSGSCCTGGGRAPGFGYGFLFGLGFLLPLLAWTGSFVGSLPWVVLSAFEALFIGLAGAGHRGRLPAPGRAGVGRGRLDRGRGGREAACRSAGCRGAGSASASPTGRCCRSPRSAASRCCRSRPCSRVSRSASWCAGSSRRQSPRRMVAPALIAVLTMAAGPMAALVPATPGGAERTVTIAAVQGNVPAARARLQRPAPGRARQPRAGHRAARRRRRRRHASRAPTS